MNKLTKLLMVGTAATMFAAACSSTPPVEMTDSRGFAEFTSITEERLPEVPGNSADSDDAIGMTAPIISGVDGYGGDVTFSWDTEVTGIMFLAHWCPVCQDKVKDMVSWPSTQVRFVSVATGNTVTRPNFPADRWLSSEGWPYEVIIDDRSETIREAFGVNAYPTVVFVDRDGKVLDRVVGPLGKPSDVEAFATAVIEAQQ